MMDSSATSHTTKYESGGPSRSEPSPGWLFQLLSTHHLLGLRHEPGTVEPSWFERRISCTILCRKKKFSGRVGRGCTVPSSRNSRCGARSQIPNLPPQLNRTFWKIRYAFLQHSRPSKAGEIRCRHAAHVIRGGHETDGSSTGTTPESCWF
jgi:hypothetical protein